LGQHKFKPPRPLNPNAAAQLRGEAPRQDQIGAGMDVRIMPQAHVIVLPLDVDVAERDGKKYVTRPDGAEFELPDGAYVAREGDELPEDLWDVVLVAQASFVKATSLTLAPGRAAVVKIPVAELGRIPLSIFRSRVDDALKANGA
jgi:hypothetical protein